ncbi:hypothetical protein N2152v2_000994 [Parachlorella kessleri]
MATDMRRALGLETEGQAVENTVSYELYLPDQGLNEVSNTRRRKSRAAAGQDQEAASTPKSEEAASGSETRQHEEDVLPDMWGSVEFGDNLEDEWFVAWLLLELTKSFPVSARVWDNDGNFMLIEAAYSLPKWLKPETEVNRVWLHSGSLHIVPLPRVPGDPRLPAQLGRRQALQLVRGSDVETRAAQKIQDVISQRLAGLPERAQRELHRLRVIVPARVAGLLQREPDLLAPAVEAFHYRDMDAMKVAARMALFPPEDLVPLQATFTRVLYAQLALQEFHPVRTYPMPLPSHPHYKAAEVGMKLTAGFEMMAADLDRGGQQGDYADGPPEAGAGDGPSGSDPDWYSFLTLLGLGACLGAQAAATTQHSAPLQQALELYRRVQQYRRRTASLAAPAVMVQRLLEEPFDMPGSHPPFDSLPPDDSDAWLREGAAELDSELQRRQGEFAEHEGKKKAKKAGAATAGATTAGEAAAFDPEALTSRLRQFMEMASGPDGAEVPAGAAGSAAGGIAGAAGAAGAGRRSEGPFGLGLDLDEDKFVAELERVLGLGPGVFAPAADEDDGVSSDSSEEGSSFYSGAGSDSGSSSADEDDEAAVAGSGGEAAPGEAPTAAKGLERSAGAAQAGIGLSQAQLLGGRAGFRQSSAKPTKGGAAGADTAANSPAITARAPSTAASHAVGRGGGGTSAAATMIRAAAAAAEGSAGAGPDRWEVATATDSDDDGEAASGRSRSEDSSSGASGEGEEEDLGHFMDAYSQAMQAQLGPTTLGRSFVRAGQQAQQPGDSHPAATPASATAAAPSAAGLPPHTAQEASAANGHAAESVGGTAGSAGAATLGHQEAIDEGGGEELQPVDIDLNMVEGLLASYHSQQGLPGPASNLAGLLGISLPPPAPPAKPERQQP